MAFDVTKREKRTSLSFLKLPLCELHVHVGASVAPHVMWSIAHQQGLRLPVNGYWEFNDLITVSDDKVHSVEDYLDILHRWTEKIQSSPAAMERCTYEIISKEYRGADVTRIELRFNPMKRNLGGERDLDHIIHAAIRGMDQAVLEYSCDAGLIFCLAREFSFALNEVIVQKAIKYRDRGVVGIDLAGSEADPSGTLPCWHHDFWPRPLSPDRPSSSSPCRSSVNSAALKSRMPPSGPWSVSFALPSWSAS